MYFWYIRLISVCMIIVMMMTLILYVLFTREPRTQALEQATPKTAPATGKLLLTLSTATSADTASPLYSLDVASHVLTTVSDIGLYGSPISTQDGRIAHTFNNGTFNGSRLALSNADGEPPQDILSLEPPFVSVGASSWSPDASLLAYEAFEPTSNILTTIDIDRATIFVKTIGDENVENIQIKGWSPVFLNDGSLLYLQHDGVYRMSSLMQEKEGKPATPERLWYIAPGVFTPSARVAVSPDNTTIALSNIDKKEMLVHTLTAASGVYSIGAGSRYEGEYFTPTFSPSGSHIAFVTYYRAKTEDVSHSGVVSLSLKTGDRDVLFNLDKYAGVSLGSWIK